MTWTATQSLDFEISVTMDIEAKGEEADYGVPQSPVWDEYNNHDFADKTITICGVDVLIAELPKTLQNAILEAAIEACDDGKWGCYE